MDTNPYQSPRAEADPHEKAPPDQTTKPLGLVDLLLFGAMVGILYHSAAGFLLGAALGIVQSVSRQDIDFYLAAGLVASLSLLGTFGGVLSGGLLGGPAAVGYGWRPTWRTMRLASRAILFCLHAIVGAWACSAFAIDSYGQWIGGELSNAWFFFLAILSLSAGVLLGGWVALLMDRRFRKAIDAPITPRPQVPFRE